MLSEAALREFKEIYKEEFGEQISDAEALELGTNLLTFLNRIYRPIKREWLAQPLPSDRGPPPDR